MLTPTDPELRKIIDDASDDLVSEADMVLDEGPWIEKFYRRCDALGIHTADATQIREVAEEVMALRLARHMLSRLVVDTEDAHQGEVFVQGSGWVREWPRQGEE